MTKKIWILIIKFYALAGQKIEKCIKVIDEFLVVAIKVVSLFCLQFYIIPDS